VSPGRAPVVIGAYDGPSGKTGLSATELYERGAVGALTDAGLSPEDVDGMLTSYSWEQPVLMHADMTAEAVGIRPKYTDTVCLGGASPAGMVGRAARAVREGWCDIAVLSSASNRASGMGKQAAIQALREVGHPLYEAPYGVFVPALYAMIAQRFMYDFSVTSEHLAQIAVSQREYAISNPLSERTEADRMTVDDVLGSRMVSDPLHVLDCTLITDFCAGLVITTEEIASTLDRTAVPILGYGEYHGTATLTQAPELTAHGARESGARALAQAGVTAADIDFAELYDSFTITVLQSLHDLGLAPDGIPAFVEGHDMAASGRLPVNTNGGMLSYATGGMYHVTEAVRQLRREAGDRQLQRTDLALVNGEGGILSANCSIVLGAPL
jgi:acetyl-CoA acetyltransferase